MHLSRSGFRSDGWALLVLTLGILILFLPSAAGILGIFHDDQAMAEFPWHYFLAMRFLDGEIPLWDPHTWSGAIPFYARYYADTYYFPLWPLYLLTRAGDLAQAYWTLSLIPLFLHYLLAGFGMYRFARRSIRLHPPGALLAAWVYVFSPAFAYSYVWFPIVVVQAWLPWLLSAVVGMDRRPGFLRVAGAGVCFSLMSLCAQPPHLGYSIVVSFLLALGLALRRFLRREFAAALRAPFQLSLALGLGFLLSAVFWLSTLDGARYTEQHIALTYADVAGKDGSVPPLYLSTLFVPDLFGSVDGRHIWGADVSYEARYWEANTSGGLLLVFLLLSGALFGALSRRPRRFRFWAWAGISVWLAALLCMLGRHTPFYHFVFSWTGPLAKFPFPIRYRMLQILAAAWLAGLGAESLLPKVRARISPRLVWGYLSVAALAVGLALLWPQDLTSTLFGPVRFSPRPWAFPGVRETAARWEGHWFWLGPFGYFLSASALLVLVWRFLAGRVRLFAALALIMLETGFFTFNAFYFGTFERRFARPEHFRTVRPSTQPLVARVLGPLTLLRSDPNLRWTTDQPYHDNLSRLNASYALMGYEMKPLERRFKTALEAAFQKTMDWPIYWDNPRAAFPSFLSHFSVGYLMDIKPDNPFPSGRTVTLGSKPRLYFHLNPDPLPRAYLQNRIVEATADEQLEELVGGDLRRGVFMVEAPAEARAAEGVSVASHGDSAAWAGQTASEEERDHFRKLQERNPILRLDLSRSNTVAAECELSSPAMLVFTELWYPGWRAKVDGRPAELFRVNYCQRGVWLAEGRHRVVLRLVPTLWVWGAAVSLIAWGGLIVASVAVAFRGTPGARLGSRRL
jgi:hypothetical protein